MENYKLPHDFEERMQRILGEEFEAFKTEILENENIRAARVNTNKISVEGFSAIAPYHMQKIPYTADGFYLYDDVRMGGEVCHQAGMFYMQEPSAMIPVNAVSISEGWKVLDLCAAPGGKSSQLSNAVGDSGLVIANDIKFERCKALVENVERLGLRNTIVTSAASDELCSYFSDFFDMVLVDATCSGEGMFRKNKNIMNYWSQKKVTSCVKIQKELLDNVASTVCPGGIIVYSTCTYSVEENEAVIEDFLDKHKEFCLVDVEEKIISYTAPGISINSKYEYNKTRRFYPHKSPGEGQYVAVLQKRGSEVKNLSCTQRKNKTSDRDKEFISEFLSKLGVTVSEEQIYIRGDKVWILPKTAILLKKHVINNGVLLGTINGPMITPSHAFFMAYGNQFYNQIDFNFDDISLDNYLRGNDIRYPADEGWGVITVNGCTLGGFFSWKGILTNHYPKNLTNKDIFD